MPQPLLTMSVQARGGINFRAMSTCLVPKLAFAVLLKRANESDEYPVTPGFVLYLQMLVEMMAAPECGSFIADGVVEPFRDMADVMGDVMGLAGTGAVSSGGAAVSLQRLCRDPALREFVHGHSYTLHACQF